MHLGPVGLGAECSREVRRRWEEARFEPPVVIDCRMKPWYPDVVEPTAETVELVDRRWGEYFPGGKTRP